MECRFLARSMLRDGERGVGVDFGRGAGLEGASRGGRLGGDDGRVGRASGQGRGRGRNEDRGEGTSAMFSGSEATSRGQTTTLDHTTGEQKYA